jgi:N utilization substance protein A
MDFGRIAAQSAKQVIVQKVREAERDRQYDEYKGRIGEIVNGQVKRVEYGNVVVDLGRGEGIIRRDELIPRETFRYGDRVRAYVYDVRREQRAFARWRTRLHPRRRRAPRAARSERRPRATCSRCWRVAARSLARRGRALRCSRG